jgi:hypothetical protein
VRYTNPSKLVSHLVRPLAGLALIAGLALLAPSDAAAQAGGSTSTVRGTVTDSSGGILPGATVTITNTGTKVARTAVSDDRGGFAFPALFAGTYELKVELQGFKTYDVKNLSLSPNDTRGIDVSLEVGSLTEVVTVTSPVEIIQTETGAREGVIRADQIENLSIMGRSSLELLRILPGVVAPDQNQLESVSFGGGANATQSYTVNGVRGSNNTVSLDGSNLIDIGCNCGLISTLNNDMVQEVKVQSSNYAAEYGSGGMSISAVTKAGTSTFHGTLYDYIRDNKTAANDRSNSILGFDKPKSTFQYPGGNVGGPVVIPGLEFTKSRNRLFFFAGYEYQYQKIDSGARLTTVPTAAMKRGDFSELINGAGQNLNMPRVVNIPGGFPGEGTPAPNNNVAPYIDAMGQYLLNIYPDPNYVDAANNRYNYVYSALEPSNRNDFKARVDYNISNNAKMYVRIARENEKNDQPRGAWWGPSQVALPTPNVADSKGHSYSGNIVNVLGPTATLESVVTYSQLKLDNYYKDPTRVRKADQGFGSFDGFFPGSSPYMPLELIHSWGGSHVGDLWSPGNDIFAYNDTLVGGAKLTKIKGAHGFKFGGSVERLTKHQNFQNVENERFIFADGWTPGGTGNTVADMLTSRPIQIEQGTRIPNGKFVAYNYDFFAQDSWKLHSNVTLEYGLRFSKMTNNNEITELGNVFNPSLYNPALGAFQDPGTYAHLNGFQYDMYDEVDPNLIPARPAQWMPRVNVAWNIDGESRNVLRGGVGMFVNRPMGNVEYDVSLRNAPNGYFTGLTANDTGLIGGRRLTYENARYMDAYARAGSGAITFLTGDQNDSDWPKTYNFSVSYGRRIFGGQVVEAAYVGTRGADLVSRRDGNAIPLNGIPFTGTVGNANLANPLDRAALDATVINGYRPFRAYSGVTFQGYAGETTYDSLQVTLSRQTGKRLQYFAAYTYGRQKGSIGGEYSTLDPIDPNRTYGILDTDRTHIFNLSWNAFLPDPIQDGNIFAKGLLNGWQLSGISTFASGVPIRLRFSGDIAANGNAVAVFGTPSFIGGAGAGPFAPVYTCDPRASGNDVGEKLFDINCLRIPNLSAGEVGEVISPYDMRTPSRMNHDITLFKNFQISGDQKIQFRVGLFNMFNMAYASPAIANDIDLTLETRCLRRGIGNNGVGGTAEVCDPYGGFEFTQNTINNFGKINLKRGHRVIEFALKYYF